MDEEVAALLKEQNKLVDTTGAAIPMKQSETTRMDFIRKVYGLLSTQLAITFGFTIFVINSPLISVFMATNPFLMVLAVVLSIITLYALVCFVDFQRRVPWNFIVLLVFTICEAYIVAYICLDYSPNKVYLTGSMTVGLCIGLTCYSFWTKSDFTLWGGFLFLATLILLMAGIILMFFNTPVLIVIFNCIGLLLFGFYLIYDTQLLMGNKALSYTIDDYILATLNLYIDIINIFLDILSLMGKR